MVMPPTVAMDFKSAMEPLMAKQRRMPIDPRFRLSKG